MLWICVVLRINKYVHTIKTKTDYTGIPIQPREGPGSEEKTNMDAVFSFDLIIITVFYLSKQILELNNIYH